MKKPNYDIKKIKDLLPRTRPKRRSLRYKCDVCEKKRVVRNVLSDYYQGERFNACDKCRENIKDVLYDYIKFMRYYGDGEGIGNDRYGPYTFRAQGSKRYK